MTEAQVWVEAARQGNAEAWERLVLAYQQPIFRLAYLLLGDADDAEDIAQETFLRAYHALDHFDSSLPLRPWLMRIAANLCRNRRRSIGRYFKALQNLLRNDAAPPSAVQLAEQNLEAAALWKVVRRLRLEDQQIIYLRYFFDCSEAETAEIIGVAKGTVKSRTYRALARLREALEKEPPQPVQEHLDVF